MKTVRYSRRDFLKSTALTAAAITLPGCAASAKPQRTVSGVKGKKPNIILILVDDLGYGDLTSYGAQDLRTPNMDSLVAGGMRLDNFYTNCPVCAPTRASVLTGRYPDLVGVPGVIRTRDANSFGYLDHEAIMLPEVLGQAGYHTGIIGKWHLGLQSPNRPNERGFDFFHGFLGDMMDDYYDHRRQGHNYMRVNEKEIDPPGHATDLFTQWSIDYITEQAGKDDPFFLYLAYNAPHVPIQPPKQYLDRVLQREPGINEKRAKLVALIEHLDDGIGKVVEAVSKNGIDDNTLIIFTSDNGGQMHAGANNGRLNGNKGQMYEGGIKVPFGAVWPGKIKPKSRSDRVALTMDLFPTICNAAGVRVTHQIEGEDFLPALLGASQPEPDRFLFWVRREGWGGGFGGKTTHAVRYGDWKLLQNTPYESLRLYNLKEDPAEKNPVSGNDAMQRKLRDALQCHIIDAGKVPWRRGGLDMSGHLEKLKEKNGNLR